MIDDAMSDQLLFNLLIEFFEEDNWDFQWMAGMSVLTLNYSGKNGHWQCYAQAREPQQQLVFYSVFPVNAAPDQRPLMAEFITRANYGMVIGNFEMDYDDGEIRYKTSVDVEGSLVTLPLIRQLVYANISITDHYFPALMRVMYSNQTPEDILADLALEAQEALSDELLLDDDDVVDETDVDEDDDDSTEEADDTDDDFDLFDDDDEPPTNGKAPDD